MKIAVIGAMEEEVKLLRKELQSPNSESMPIVNLHMENYTQDIKLLF